MGLVVENKLAIIPVYPFMHYIYNVCVDVSAEEYKELNSPELVAFLSR